MHTATVIEPPALSESTGPLPGEVKSTVRSFHVVIVDEELPYPPTSGKRIRTLNLTLRLARRHRITYFCHRNADPAEARQAAAFFREQGIEPVVVNRRVPRKRGPVFYGRLAANLFSPFPYSVVSHTSRALREAIRDYAAKQPVDLWQCEWTPYAQVLRELAGVRRVIVAHNVESQIWQRYAENEPNLLKRWYIWGQGRKFARFERWAYGTGTRTVAVSAEDAAFIRDRFAARHVDVVDNGVDTKYFRPSAAARDVRQILFLGSLDWRPNLDAVRLLLNTVFPAVQSAEPAARLWIVGRNPPSWLRRQIAALPGVELHADVADVRPFLTHSGVLAVPLRIGGGSRLKILEALACGLPVVSTRVGAEGLRLVPGKHLVVVASAGELAGALTSCLRNPEPARQMAECGRQVVLEHYDWDVLAERLEQVWLDCMKISPCPPQALTRASPTPR